MKFSPDGQELVAAHPTDQCSFQGWSVNTGRQLSASCAVTQHPFRL